MTEIVTSATLRGVGGFQEWGRLTRTEMIKRTREYATAEKEKMEKILAASDDDFDVRVMRGPRVQHLIERLEK